MPTVPPLADLLGSLVRAHRAAQADHRAALAAEHARDLAAARRQLAAIDARIRELGHPDLADQLSGETTTGIALIVALTGPSEPSNELGSAIAAFVRTRADVDATRARDGSWQPAT